MSRAEETAFHLFVKTFDEGSEDFIDNLCVGLLDKEGQWRIWEEGGSFCDSMELEEAFRILWEHDPKGMFFNPEETARRYAEFQKN